MYLMSYKKINKTLLMPVECSHLLNPKFNIKLTNQINIIRNVKNYIDKDDFFFVI